MTQPNSKRNIPWPLCTEPSRPPVIREDLPGRILSGMESVEFYLSVDMPIAAKQEYDYTVALLRYKDPSIDIPPFPDTTKGGK